MDTALAKAEGENAALKSTIGLTSQNLHRQNLPSIGRELLIPSLAGTIAFACYALALFFVPGTLAWLTFNTAMPVALKWLVILILEFIAGWGLFALASATHEGFHFTLHKNKIISGLIGLFFSSAVPGFFGMGFFVYHWNHHKFTNTSKDPDCAHFSKYNNLFSRLLFVRISTNMRYAQYVLNMALGKVNKFKYVAPLTADQLKFFSRINVLTQLFWLSLYASIAYINVKVFSFLVLLPMVFVLLITGITPYLEHADTSLEAGKNSRSRASVIFSLLQIGTNFHNEHHMYPAVPCWRLHKVYLHLRYKGFYKTDGLPPAKGFFVGFKYASSKYKYTKGLDLK